MFGYRNVFLKLPVFFAISYNVYIQLRITAELLQSVGSQSLCHSM